MCSHTGEAHCGGCCWCGYLSCSEVVSCSNSSHKWGRWYFPRFLLRERSFTEMYIASFMVLVTPCASLSTMVKHSKSTRCPVNWLCWWMGDGAPTCSLNLSPRVPPNSPMSCSGQSVWGHLNCYITLLFWCMLSLGAMSRVLMLLFPLKCTCMPTLLRVFLNFSLSPLVYSTTINMFLYLEPVLFCWLLLTLCGLFVLCLWLNCICCLLRAWGELAC